MFCPNPRAQRVSLRTVEIIQTALGQVGAPQDLVLCIERSNRETTDALMRAADYVVATGGANTVRRAYGSGTPAIGGGVGNATVIVDEAADLADAARKIAFGASFNNGTSCSSESNVLVASTVADQFADELRREGALLCDPAETDRLRALMWTPGNTLDRSWAGLPAAALAAAAGIRMNSSSKPRLLVAVSAKVDLADPLFGEKLAPVITLTPYDGFEDAIGALVSITDTCGRGHSCALHTSRPERVSRLADQVRLCRVMVNQSTAVGVSGSFDNGLSFTHTIASGSWGGSSQSQNITWRHFLNVTTVSYPIEPQVPTEENSFGTHWARYGTSTAMVTPIRGMTQPPSRHSVFLACSSTATKQRFYLDHPWLPA